jgi:hypothetical protein
MTRMMGQLKIGGSPAQSEDFIGKSKAKVERYLREHENVSVGSSSLKSKT